MSDNRVKRERQSARATKYAVAVRGERVRNGGVRILPAKVIPNTYGGVK